MTRFAPTASSRRAVIQATILLLLTTQLNAQITETKLVPSDGAAQDHFGTSVAVSEEILIVGSPEDDDNGVNSGSAYLYRWDGTDWSQVATLFASNAGAQDFFGSAVDINGDRAIVGASGVDGDRGAAYVFRLDGSIWVEEAILTTGNGSGGDFFGSSVSIDGEYALVGAFGHSSASGAAYVFRRIDTSWTEVATLTASDGSTSDYLGVSVSLSGNYALVGAWWDDDNGLNSGSAYVFRRDGLVWTEEAKLMAGDGAADDYFGFSVSISGTFALIGVYGDDDNGSGSGSAYIFRRSGTDWVEQTKLRASDAASNDFFGYSVELWGEYALIGSPFDDDRGGSSGSAYLFHLEGTDWRRARKFVASDGSESDHFGRAVTLSDEFAVSGAHDDDVAGSSSGSAYVYAGFGGLTSAAPESDSHPADFTLLQNYPNPFNPTTQIGFHLPTAHPNAAGGPGQAAITKYEFVSLRVYDLLGREVAILIDEKLSPGEYVREWDAKDVPSGVYFYQLKARGSVQARRMVVLK